MRKLLLIFMAVIAISCGNDKKKEEPAKTTIGAPQVEEATTEEAAVNDAVVNLTIEGNDQMQFNKKEIRVKAGQTVRLTLKHVGKMDINVMGHNWVLVTPDTDINKFGADAVDAEDHIPSGYEDNIIVHTKMLGGGESDTIEFEAPEPGTYEFLCSFPGHVALMRGKFIVE